MNHDPRLEAYLASLEQVLKPFPVSDRAEIVTEIKSHILSALERDPQAQLDSVLAALGEPQTVANRYLIERGLKPTKPPINPIVKWLIVGFLGTLALSVIVMAVLAFKFSPILHIDGEKDQITFLGGLVKIDGSSHSRFQGYGRQKGESSLLEGKHALPSKEEVSVKFNNGEMTFHSTNESRFSWKCQIPGRGTPSSRGTPGAFSQETSTLDLTSFSGVVCQLWVPHQAKLNVDGTNGDISFEKPHYHLNADLVNGNVVFNPDKSEDYRYSFSVTSGNTDTFVSSDKSNAYSVAIHLVNGNIGQSK